MSNNNLTPYGNEPLQYLVGKIVNDLEEPVYTINTAKKTAIVTGKKGGKNICAKLEASDLGKTASISEYDQLPRKSDYAAEVKRLYRQGLKQKEIALRLGISQSLVSKLLNDK